MASITRKRGAGRINTRWASQGGSVCLLDQKAPVTAPRARNKQLNAKAALEPKICIRKTLSSN
jgi:hypothetical protein